MRFATAAALLLLLAGLPARLEAAKPASKPAPAPTNDDCLACHSDTSLKRSEGRDAFVVPETFAASVHGLAGLACVDCHADLAKATEFPHAEKLAKAACGSCHDKVAAEFGQSVHAEARAHDPKSLAATCSDCHGSHDIRPAKDRDARTYHLTLVATCGKCHGNEETIRKAKIAEGNVSKLFEDSIHGKALAKSGLMVAPNCANCHGVHDIRRKKDPASKVAHGNVPATCGSCHEGVLKKYDDGVHGAAIRRGNPTAPVCIDCHTAHHIARAEVEAWRLDVIRECGTCHEHSMRSYRDTYHGQVTSLGFARVASCADCHNAHDIFTKADARSTVSEAGRVKTCQKCHKGVGANFAKYDPHANTHDRSRNPLLYYTAWFMKSLLFVVFGFFWVHTALWIPRAFVERRKLKAAGHGAPKTEPSEKG